MGVVHLGQKPGERPVAIKVLRPHVVGDDEARRRLAREVSSLSRVRSRRIAEIVDADPWGEIPYVATRYVPGLSLHDHVQEEGPLEGDDLLWFADCLAEALEAVHDVGVLHRDIKPSNVIMEGRTPILIDFGLARVAEDSRITMTGWLLGTPGYLAPEILYGDDATAASDVHAWAATVAYAGTGRAPFGRGPSVAIMDRVRRGEHDLTGLDPVVLELVEEALAPDAEDRPSLEEVRDWLEELASPSVDEGPPGPSRERRGQPVTLPYVAGVRQDLEAPTASAPGVAPAPVQSELVHWSRRVTHDDRRNDLYGDRPTAGLGRRRHGAAPTDARAARRLRRVRQRLRPDRPRGVPGRRAAAPPAHAARPRRRRRRAASPSRPTSRSPSSSSASGCCAAARWRRRSVGSRRDRRGTKWYDGIQLLLAAPWHVVAGLGGTVLLFLWSLGIAAAIALLCFAASLSMLTSLAAIGVFFAVGTWWGPGSERLRSPIHRVVDPLARRGVPWLLVTLLVAAARLRARSRRLGGGDHVGAGRRRAPHRRTPPGLALTVEVDAVR